MKRMIVALLALTALVGACSDSDGNPVAPGSSSSDPLIYFVPSKSCSADIRLQVTVDGTAVVTWDHFSSEQSIHIHPGKHTIQARDLNHRSQLLVADAPTVSGSFGLGVACPN